jgi:hypothetical protein
MVVILVLCIVMIVVSPYVDLPLTTVRACLAAVVFAQVFLLGAMVSEPRLLLIARRMSQSGTLQVARRKPAQLLPLLCAYLC